MVDGIIIRGEAGPRLTEAKRRLLSLHDHWVIIQSHLPSCTLPAVGIESSLTYQHTGR